METACSSKCLKSACIFRINARVFGSVSISGLLLMLYVIKYLSQELVLFIV